MFHHVLEGGKTQRPSAFFCRGMDTHIVQLMMCRLQPVRKCGHGAWAALYTNSLICVL